MKVVARTSEEVQRFLAGHRIPTLNIAGILEHETQLEVFVDCEVDPRGLLVKGPWFWYAHTEQEAFLEEVILEMQKKEGFYQFSGLWRPLAQRLQARFPLVWHAPCDLYVLPEGTQVPPREGSPATSVHLEDAELIDAHYAYRHSGSLEKIRTCIQHRPSSGIYIDGQLVCWLLVHEDESLGIMYTLEEHRRKGYALDVSLDLVDKQLKAGKTPFLQIREDNNLSPGLALKCGLRPEGQCDWFGIMVGMPKELLESSAGFQRRIQESGWLFEEDVLCFCRFLYRLSPDPTMENPVVEVPREEWLAFAVKRFEEGSLRAAVEYLGKDLRFLGERREGVLQAAAALLVDDDDGFALLWPSSQDAPFLERALERAKTLKLGTVFVHVHPSDRAVFEGLGFLAVEPPKATAATQSASS